MAKSTQREITRNQPPKSGNSPAATLEVENESMNHGLSAAKKAKQDEFLAPYADIQKKVEACLAIVGGAFTRFPSGRAK